jgi:2-keto-4-pentenoate hydratase/2-oxohepta-3-ene-1,7-dioic acid hydratase in catechol pathway
VDEALDYVFGYTIWNDMSARDTQADELPIGMGPAKAKDWDGSNVLGPCIVTAAEIDPQNLHMSVRERRDLGQRQLGAHAPLHRGDDPICVAGADNLSW